jgi:hypothetical protein
MALRADGTGVASAGASPTRLSPTATESVWGMEDFDGWVSDFPSRFAAEGSSGWDVSDVVWADADTIVFGPHPYLRILRPGRVSRWLFTVFPKSGSGTGVVASVRQNDALVLLDVRDEVAWETQVIVDERTTWGWSPEGERLIVKAAGAGWLELHLDEGTITTLPPELETPSPCSGGQRLAVRNGRLVRGRDGGWDDLGEGAGVSRPVQHPSLDFMAFERGGFVWVCNADGSDAQRVMGGSKPTWVGWWTGPTNRPPRAAKLPWRAF